VTRGEARSLRIEEVEAVLASNALVVDACRHMVEAEGSLWVARYLDRKIHQIDPETGAVLRTIESNRYVTGVTWVDRDLWHGIWEGDESELRRIDPQSGEVLQTLAMPAGAGVSGLESDGADRLFCGGRPSGRVRAVRRPK
jgi:glutamine cyclotransferase